MSKCVRQNLDDACEGCFPALSTGATEVNGIRLTAPITKFSDFIDLLDSTEVNGIRLATHLTKVSQLLHLLELTDWPSFITRGPPGEGEVLPTPVTDNNAVTVLDRLDWLMKWKTLQQAASKHPDKVFMAIILLARLEDAAGNLPHLPEIILHFWKLIIYALRCPGIDARDCKLVFAVHNFDERKAEDGTEYWQWIGAVPRGRASRTIPERATFQVRLLFYSRTSLLMLTLIGDCRVDIRRIVGGDTRENQAWQLWSKMPL